MPDTFIGAPWRQPYTAQQLQAAVENQVPIVGSNGNWWRWDISTSAWQDTGVTVATSLADGSVTMSKLAVEARPIRRNLLINSYFVGGGSQQGGGQFPINQRGQTEYPNAGYGINMWRTWGGLTVKVEADGLMLINTAESDQAGLFSYFEPSTTTDEPYIFSILTADNNLYSVISPGFSPGIVWGTKAPWGQLTITRQSGVVGNVAIRVDKAQSVQPVAAMFEKGTDQTLAHKDAAGNWVLNGPPPDYALELLKCQRYFVEFPDLIDVSGVAFGSGASQASVTISLPVSMRIRPTIEYTIYSVTQNGQRIDDVSLTPLGISGNQLRLRVTRASGNWLPNEGIHIILSRLAASAEL